MNDVTQAQLEAFAATDLYRTALIRMFDEMDRPALTYVEQQLEQALADAHEEHDDPGVIVLRYTLREVRRLLAELPCPTPPEGTAWSPDS